jgi:hypothetical protein
MVFLIIHQENQSSFKNKVSGIIFLDGNPVFNSAMIERELTTRHKMRINKKTANEGVAIFLTEKYRIVIVAVDAEIPPDEIESVCKISHLWKDAFEHASKHLSHIILSVSTDVDDFVELNLQFTRIAATLLRNTKSIGIYLENQSLISPSESYVKIADNMNSNDLPLANWIYFGLRENNLKRNGFTIGLKEFGFREIEFADSEKTFEEIHKILYDLSHHVLLSRQPLKEGDTFDLTETEKITLESRPGEFRDTETMHVICEKSASI